MQLYVTRIQIGDFVKNQKSRTKAGDTTTVSQIIATAMSFAIRRAAVGGVGRHTMRSGAPLRFFSAAMPRLQTAQAPSQESQAEILKKLNVKDPAQLISWKSKYLKPEDITPLKEAHELYATVHIYDRKFLVTEGDEVRIPVDFKSLEVGDVLNLKEVSTIGSRDHTLTGGPRIDPSVFTIKAVVTEKTKVKHKVLEKTRRRRRHVKHVVVKPPLTVLRISQLSVNQDF